MRKGILFFVVGLWVAQTARAAISRECAAGQECLVEVPGAQCADGTSSFFTLTRRSGAKNLLIYLTGGGACWSRRSCRRGLARTLTREETATDWTNGGGIQDASDSSNPFARDYDVVTIPYCTGDVYAGDRDADYGGGLVMRHRGFRNVRLILEAVKKIDPTPAKAVLLGCSAGGIGAYYHLADFSETFPQSERYVISDAGTPFKPPFLYQERYDAIMQSWGADRTLAGGTRDFGALIGYNTKHFPDVHFALISSYFDRTMSFFALAVGSPAPFSAVRSSIVDAADNAIGRNAENAKVFFTQSSAHCQTGLPLQDVTSNDAHLGDWLSAMVGDDRAAWIDERPDLQSGIEMQ